MEKRTATLGDALRNINQEIKFTYLGDDYDTLEILSDHEKPTKEAIESARVIAQKEIDNSFYQFQRQLEYPPIQECIHALLDGGDTLTELQSKRSEIKNKYPKSD